jgi:hypothetical protein
MYYGLLPNIIEDCRKRDAAGDCPPPSPYSRETLEDAILTQDAKIARLRAELTMWRAFADADEVDRLRIALGLAPFLPRHPPR